MVIDLIQTALLVCDGMEFSHRSACPSCGGALQGYDTRKKNFAVILENEKERLIQVKVRRFYCKTCKTLCYANEPFYPDTRMGSPLIDLCLTLASTISFSRTATSLSLLGIVIDRGSVRNYANRNFPEIPKVPIFNLQIPHSIISLTALANSAPKRSGIDPYEVLAACGFPSAGIHAVHLPHSRELGKRQR
ncbi:MAG: hypothetical protein WCF90_02530 [Methanomicrobiales archaeon]